MTTIVRLGVPVLIGAVLLLFGIQQVLASGRFAETADMLSEVRSGMLPITIGVALLVGALAIARRSRFGYLFGLAAAVLVALAGLLLIAMGILSPGQGLYGSTGVPLMLGGAFLLLAGVGYFRSFRKARSTFAPGWRREDRWIAAAFAVLVVVSSGLFVGLGAVLGGR